MRGKQRVSKQSQAVPRSPAEQGMKPSTIRHAQLSNYGFLFSNVNFFLPDTLVQSTKNQKKHCGLPDNGALWFRVWTKLTEINMEGEIHKTSMIQSAMCRDMPKDAFRGRGLNLNISEVNQKKNKKKKNSKIVVDIKCSVRKLTSWLPHVHLKLLRKEKNKINTSVNHRDRGTKCSIVMNFWECAVRMTKITICLFFRKIAV